MNREILQIIKDDSRIIDLNYPSKLLLVEVGGYTHWECYIGLPKNHPYAQVGEKENNNKFDHRKKIFKDVIKMVQNKYPPRTHSFDIFKSTNEIKENIKKEGIRPAQCITPENFYVGNSYDYLDNDKIWYSINLCTKFFDSEDCKQDAMYLMISLNEFFWKNKDINIKDFGTIELAEEEFKKTFPNGIKIKKNKYKIEDEVYRASTNSNIDIVNGYIGLYPYGYDDEGYMEYEITLKPREPYNKKTMTGYCTNYIYKPLIGKVIRSKDSICKSKLFTTYIDTLYYKMSKYKLNKKEIENLKTYIKD